VLEIGTGTGYQTAVLARLAAHVFTVDRYRTLVAAAESRFKTLRLTNITARVGDGTDGWPEQAPFDRIVVTAAADDVPQALTEQVRIGGVLVMPVGPVDDVQKLMRLERTERGFSETPIADVRFVPLIPGVAEKL
jgi:protein-L-isoaspartate(D-aspartate) O-methyltransferase